ncbi:hypothetical protein NL676_007225, partial [Syzygium grande]
LKQGKTPRQGAVKSVSAREVLGETTASKAVTEAWDERLELQEWMNKGLNEKSKLLNSKNRGSENRASRPNSSEPTPAIALGRVGVSNCGDVVLEAQLVLQ